MSEPTTVAGEPTIVIDPSTSKPSPPAPAPAGEGAAKEKSDWSDIGARLDQQKKSILKAIGVDSIESAKAALDKLAKQEEADKSVAQKAAEYETSFKAAKAEKDALAETLGGYAKAEMAKLNDAQKAAVAEVAGDNPALQLKTISALMPTWAGAAAPAATAGAVTDSTPSTPMPAGGGTTPAVPDLKAQYAELSRLNPIIAARFAIENRLFDDWTK